MENLKKLSRDELKSRMLELLKKYIQVCEDNNLKYYLTWGALIGAVRHGGFIPWDDDIDLMMPREDYSRFLDLCEKNDYGFDCFSYEKTPKYCHYFAKVCDRDTVLRNIYMKDEPEMGVFIDILPMDEVMLDDKSQVKYAKKITTCSKLLELTAMKKYWPADGFVKNIVKHMIFSYTVARGNDYWQKRLKRIISKAQSLNNGTKKQYMGVWNVWDKDIYGDGSVVTFEGIPVKAPADVDGFLTDFYGDYMQLPPEDQRVSPHDFDAYFKE